MTVGECYAVTLSIIQDDDTTVFTYLATTESDGVERREVQEEWCEVKCKHVRSRYYQGLHQIPAASHRSRALHRHIAQLKLLVLGKYF